MLSVVCGSKDRTASFHFCIFSKLLNNKESLVGQHGELVSLCTFVPVKECKEEFSSRDRGSLKLWSTQIFVFHMSRCQGSFLTWIFLDSEKVVFSKGTCRTLVRQKRTGMEGLKGIGGKSTGDHLLYSFPHLRRGKRWKLYRIYGMEYRHTLPFTLI